jgi:hypothetical protein
VEDKVDAVALKKAKDDAVAANIKILENFYSFIIGFALTQATMKLVDSWVANGGGAEMLGASVLYASLLITIVPFYQGMNRFLYVTHVVRPIEKPEFRSSPMLLDIYAFLFMSCIIFAMGRFLNNPTTFFYLWSLLLVVDILWAAIVWKIQKSREPLWAWNNLLWLCIAWSYWALIRASHPREGRVAIVTNVAVRCGGREGRSRRARLTRTAKSCGPDVAVLASSCAGFTPCVATVAKEPFTGESTK